MSENIYQDQIIEWSKKADNIYKLEHAHCRATANNPLCGDKITVELQLDGDVIMAIGYQIKGCLLCKASSSILAETAIGLTFDELSAVGDKLERALKSSKDDHEGFPERYRMFFPVRLHKSRHPCVLLPFDAVRKAVSEKGETVTV